MRQLSAAADAVQTAEELVEEREPRLAVAPVGQRQRQRPLLPVAAEVLWLGLGVGVGLGLGLPRVRATARG